MRKRTLFLVNQNFYKIEIKRSPKIVKFSKREIDTLLPNLHVYTFVYKFLSKKKNSFKNCSTMNPCLNERKKEKKILQKKIRKKLTLLRKSIPMRDEQRG